MNYSWVCLSLSLLSFVGLLISYFIEGFISWSNHMTGSCTKMFLTTLRAAKYPKPYPSPNPILASMPNIYLCNSLNFVHFFKNFHILLILLSLILLIPFNLHMNCQLNDLFDLLSYFLKFYQPLFSCVYMKLNWN